MQIVRLTGQHKLHHFRFITVFFLFNLFILAPVLSQTLDDTVVSSPTPYYDGRLVCWSREIISTSTYIP